VPKSQDNSGQWRHRLSKSRNRSSSILFIDFGLFWGGVFFLVEASFLTGKQRTAGSGGSWL